MIKGKFKLTGIGNDSYRYYYSIVKSEEFKIPFIKFMVELGFDEKRISEYFEDYDERGEKPIHVKINWLNDKVFTWKNEDFDIDCFFGRKKIILIIRTKKHQKLINSLEKYSEWEKNLIKKGKKKWKRKMTKIKNTNVVYRRK